MKQDTFSLFPFTFEDPLTKCEVYQITLDHLLCLYKYSLILKKEVKKKVERYHLRCKVRVIVCTLIIVL